jgi:hypothetical protein
MKPIDTVNIAATVPPIQPAPPIVSLTQRMQTSEQNPLPEQEEEEEEWGQWPLPVDQESAMASKWAIDMFIEKIFFGEEEENGIPPLTIDI